MHKLKNHPKLVLILSILICSAGAILLFAFYGHLPATKIHLLGTAGLSFAGDIRADGRIFSVSGLLPAEFVIPGRSVACSFSKKSPVGKLVIRIFAEDGLSFQETFTEQPKGGVQGEIHITQAKLGTLVDYSTRGSTVTIFEN